MPERRVRVFPNLAAAWDAAAEGAGIAPAVRHLVAHRLRRGDLVVVETAATPMDVSWYVTAPVHDRRSGAASALIDFMTTPTATQLLLSPDGGVPRSRFRPAVRVSIWD